VIKEDTDVEMTNGTHIIHDLTGDASSPPKETSSTDIPASDATADGNTPAVTDDTETTCKVVNLYEQDEQDVEDGIYPIGTFVKRELSNASMWMLGDKLMCARFANYTITYLMRYFENFPVGFSDTEFVYDNTMPNSKLRVLYRDLIAGNGPLRYALNTRDHDEWLLLLAKGGDLVKEWIQKTFSSPRKDDANQSWAEKYRRKYLQKVDDVRVSDWPRKMYPIETYTISGTVSPPETDQVVSIVGKSAV
jgi:hypothetical protein